MRLDVNEVQTSTAAELGCQTVSSSERTRKEKGILEDLHCYHIVVRIKLAVALLSSLISISLRHNM